MSHGRFFGALTSRSQASVRLRCAWILVTVVITSLSPVSARITRTHPSAASTSFAEAGPSVWGLFYPFVLGGGFEFQSDCDQSDYRFPFLIEYSVTERIRLTLEPEFVHIVGKTKNARSVHGTGDIEAWVAYEFVTQRRYRPSLSVEVGNRWPTAIDPDLGEPGWDYTVGLIATKDLVIVDVDVNAFYSFVGNREREDTVELSLSTEWHVNPYIDLIAEVATVAQVGGSRGDQPRNEVECTLGVAWLVNEFFRLEHGIVLSDRGGWEVIFGWEWNIGGD